MKSHDPIGIGARNLALLVLCGALSAPLYAAGSHAGGHGHGQSSMHGDGHHDKGGHHDFGAAGQPGKSEDVSRTIEITLFDNYYEPEKVTVSAGETVRFRVTNRGQLVHEFNIGVPAMHREHQKEMLEMMQHGALLPDRIDHERMKMDMGGGKTMQHDDPNSVLLEPGKSGEVIWKFTNAATIEFACNVPGHYEAGMVGRFHFE
ncbi:MAG: cupredoxin family protein [Gammaproteobacteria bacterium]|nr:cupredoxin family protein [Gammaproteobacteria bacterium]